MQCEGIQEIEPVMDPMNKSYLFVKTKNVGEYRLSKHSGVDL